MTRHSTTLEIEHPLRVGDTLKDLLPGFVSAERGGVVRIADLQAQGYAYLRP